MQQAKTLRRHDLQQREGSFTQQPSEETGKQTSELPPLRQGVIYLFIYLFIFGCVGSLLLRVGLFISCGERGLLFVAVRGLLIVVATLVAEHRI